MTVTLYIDFILPPDGATAVRMDAGAAADSVIVELPDEKAPIVSKYGV